MRIRGRLGKAALVIVSLAVSLAAAEAITRVALPWLFPRAATTSPETGLPLGWLEGRLRGLREARPELVIIGDSFVATGERQGGWIPKLQRAWRVESLGNSGACPSQYWLIFDRLRRAGVSSPVLLVLYIGNDFLDEVAWATLGPDRSGYAAARHKLVGDPSRATFYPCFALQPRGLRATLERESALYRLLLVAGRAPARVMLDRCDKAPWAEQVGGRLFFLLRHDPMLDPRDPSLRRAHEDVLAGFERHRSDPRLIVAPILDREETCAAVHGRPVYRAAAFIDRLRALGLRVVDVNAAMSRACEAEEIYAPDGHWNWRGHDTFAEALAPVLAREMEAL